MRPDIAGNQWLLNAFYELSTCRQIGMDLGPIPLTAIQAYSDRHELGELFVLQIMEIDRLWLASRNKDKKVKRNG